MALTIHRDRPAESEVVADRRLYLSADKARVVEEGDPDAAYLFATPGTVLLADDVARYGLDTPAPEPAESEAEEAPDGAEAAPRPRARGARRR